MSKLQNFASKVEQGQALDIGKESWKNQHFPDGFILAGKFVF